MPETIAQSTHVVVNEVDAMSPSWCDDARHE